MVKPRKKQCFTWTWLWIWWPKTVTTVTVASAMWVNYIKFATTQLFLRTENLLTEHVQNIYFVSETDVWLQANAIPCLHICMFARISQKQLSDYTSQNFYACMLTGAVTWSLLAAMLCISYIRFCWWSHYRENYDNYTFLDQAVS